MPEKIPNSQLQMMTELQVRMQTIVSSVERLIDNQEGTVKSRGMKERITIAESDIERNKQAWEKVDNRINSFEKNVNQTIREAFTEISNDINTKFDTLSKSVDTRISDVATESKTQKGIIQKMQPIVNVVSWLFLTAGGIIVGLILSGKWQITIH